MISKLFQGLSVPLVVLMLVFSGQIAYAGPPLICHPFEINGARSLPWSGSDWLAVKPDYNVNRLVDDTLALLTPGTSVLTRMETLRRATVYAVWSTVNQKSGYTAKDLTVARDLLVRLQSRAADAKGTPAEAMALFDLGYLVESYRQTTSDADALPFIRGIDGYDFVVKAIGLSHKDPQMEFAAAVISEFPKRTTHQLHLREAVAGAPDDSLLANNLVLHFSYVGKTIAELRAAVEQRS
jgi:hypothetical protein